MPDTQVLAANQPDAVARAVKILETGGTVAFPTETVYGLAAGLTQAAIKKLFAIKARDEHKSIAVLLGDVGQLPQVTPAPDTRIQQLAAAFWPGPLTMVLPRHPDLPAILSPTPTVGVRIPDHPVALALLRAIGPLAVTSANLSGGANTRTAAEVLAQLGGRVDLLLDGGSSSGRQTPAGLPSTVIRFSNGEIEILREGPLTLDELNKVWNS